jgi:hypothetical protein
MTTVVSVAQGGTGSNSAALARTALGVPPSAAYDQANTARDQANTARTQANSAYAQANSAYSDANTRLSASGGTLAGDLIITGNLTVSGNSTTLNAEILTIEDADVVLLSNVASTPALNAGIIVNRGTSTNTFLRWDEVTDKWGWSDDGSTTYKFTSALDAYAQANSAYGAANNRVLKAGDTMTGQLNISSGGLLVTGNVGIGTASPGHKLEVYGAATRLGLNQTQGGPTSTNVTANATLLLSGTGGNYLAFGQYGASQSHAQWIQSAYENPTTATYNLILQPLGGNIGIGTTSPGYKLDVSSDIHTGNELYLDNGKYLRFTRSSGGLSIQTLGIESGTDNVRLLTTGDFNILNGSLTNLMTVKNAGNVGIGTSSPAEKLEVNGANTSIAAYNNSISVGSGFTRLKLGRDTNYNAGLSAYVASGQPGVDRVSLGFHVTTFTSSLQTFYEAMTITDAGNVGIGTTNPSTRLTISKPIDSSSYGSGTKAIDFKVYFPGYDIDTIKASIYAGVSSQGTLQTTKGYLAFLTSSTGGVENLTEKLRIEADGNVGIGTTSPGQKLDVYASSGSVMRLSVTDGAGSGDFGTDYYIQNTGHQIARISAEYVSSAANGYGSIHFSNRAGGALTKRMTILYDGNVGIGTTSPSTKLHVEGTGFFTSTLTSGSAATNATRIALGSNGDIQEYFATEANPRWRIHRDLVANGKAGIGFNDTSGTIAATGCAVGVTSTAGTLAFYTTNGTSLTERMSIDNTGNVSIKQTPGKYTIDTTGGQTSIANNGTVDFPSASGLLIVNNHNNGGVTIYLCGGGNTTAVSSVIGQVGTLAYNSGVAGYTWTNNYGSTATFGFFFIRTRPTA